MQDTLIIDIILSMKNEKINFRIRQLSWFKRRSPTKEPEPVAVNIPDFEKTENHMCDVFTTFDDGVERKLMGRVTHNSIRDTWSVNAIANGGYAVFAELVE